MAGFTSYLDEVVYILEKQTGIIEQEIMERGVQLIQKHTPVKSGKLRKNMTYEKTPFGWAWVNDTPYTTYVEFGTERMAPRAMFRKGIAELTAEIPGIIESVTGAGGMVSGFGIAGPTATPTSSILDISGAPTAPAASPPSSMIGRAASKIAGVAKSAFGKLKSFFGR